MQIPTHSASAVALLACALSLVPLDANAATLEGLVLHASEPTPGATVVIQSPGGFYAKVITDNNGHWQITVPVGVFHAVAIFGSSLSGSCDHPMDVVSPSAALVCHVHLD